MSQPPSGQNVATTSSVRPSSSAWVYAAIAARTPSATSAYVVLIADWVSETEVGDRHRAPLSTTYADACVPRHRIPTGRYNLRPHDLLRTRPRRPGRRRRHHWHLPAVPRARSGFFGAAAGGR